MHEINQIRGSPVSVMIPHDAIQQKQRSSEELEVFLNSLSPLGITISPSLVERNTSLVQVFSKGVFIGEIQTYTTDFIDEEVFLALLEFYKYVFQPHSLAVA